jgi:hypothetical protein
MPSVVLFAPGVLDPVRDSEWYRQPNVLSLRHGVCDPIRVDFTLGVSHVLSHSLRQSIDVSLSIKVALSSRCHRLLWVNHGDLVGLPTDL